MVQYFNMNEHQIELFQKLKFFKALNDTECHNKFQYHSGLNIDSLPFHPHGTCAPGGLYFASNNILDYIHQSQLFIREVTFPENARIYLDHLCYDEEEDEEEDEFDYTLDDDEFVLQKWKADRIILGPRRHFIADKGYELFLGILPFFMIMNTIISYASESELLDILKQDNIKTQNFNDVEITKIFQALLRSKDYDLMKIYIIKSRNEIPDYMTPIFHCLVLCNLPKEEKTALIQFIFEILSPFDFDQIADQIVDTIFKRYAQLRLTEEQFELIYYTLHLDTFVQENPTSLQLLFTTITYHLSPSDIQRLLIKLIDLKCIIPSDTLQTIVMNSQIYLFLNIFPHLQPLLQWDNKTFHEYLLSNHHYDLMNLDEIYLQSLFQIADTHQFTFPIHFLFACRRVWKNDYDTFPTMPIPDLERITPDNNLKLISYLNLLSLNYRIREFEQIFNQIPSTWHEDLYRDLLYQACDDDDSPFRIYWLYQQCDPAIRPTYIPRILQSYNLDIKDMFT